MFDIEVERGLSSAGCNGAYPIDCPAAPWDAWNGRWYWCRRWGWGWGWGWSGRRRRRRSCPPVIADDIHYSKIHVCEVVLHAGTTERVEGVIRAAGPILQIAAVQERVVECLEERRPVINGERSGRT